MNRREWLEAWLAFLASAGARGAGPRDTTVVDPLADDESQEEPEKEPFSLFVPTPERVVIRMLELARTGARDVVLDLGSGDGRIPILAARRFGARGRGIDINPELVGQSIAEAKRRGVAGRVRFEQGDVTVAPFEDATVVTMYLFPALINRLRPRLLAELRPGTRIVIYDYSIADWPPEETLTMYVPERYLGRGGDASIRLWIVPGNFSGRWSGEILGTARPRVELSIRQHFQRIEGEGRVNGAGSELYTTHARGSELEFWIEPDRTQRYEFKGRLMGELLQGTVVVERQGERARLPWRARRVSPPGEIFGSKGTS